MTEPEIDMRNGHNHCRGLGKYGRWAAFALMSKNKTNTQGLKIEIQVFKTITVVFKIFKIFG